MLKAAAVLAVRHAAAAGEPALQRAAPALQRALAVSRSSSFKPGPLLAMQLCAAWTVPNPPPPPPPPPSPCAQSAAQPAPQPQSDDEAHSKTYSEGYVAMHKGMQPGSADYVSQPSARALPQRCRACRPRPRRPASEPHAATFATPAPPSARGLAARLLSLSPSCGELDASASPTAYPNTHHARPRC
jgi:hypothetical protein